jgi:5'-nucleotidase
LRTIPDVQVIVSAPLTNQSGSGDRISADGPQGAGARTASGRAAFAVPGTPADSVVWALDEHLKRRPHVVVSGVNQGQNVGPLAEVSGTVGAARTAARRGIPALAVSQGLGDPPDYPTGARLARQWVAGHRNALLASTTRTKPVKVVKIEIPTCAPGQKIRGTVSVPLATSLDNREPFMTDCGSTAKRPKDDVEAFNEGFAPISTFDPELPTLQ